MNFFQNTTSQVMTYQLSKVLHLKPLKAKQKWEAKILELAEALDTYIPEPERASTEPFILPIEDVFSISGRGTVVTGRVERGIVKVGEEVEIVGIKDTTKTTCTGVEMFRKLLDEGRAGENVGVLLRGTKREDVERGQVLAKPGSITPHYTSKQKSTFCLKKKVDVTLHSSKATVHSSTSVQLT